MKVKHIIPLTLLSVLSLTSCGKDPYVGDYSFQMGRDKGTHLNVTIDLTTEAYVTEGVSARKFKLTGDIVIERPEDEQSDDQIDYNSILQLVYAILGDGSCINGYYSVDDVFDKDKYHLTLGFNVDDTIVSAIKELIEAIIGSEIPEVPSITPAFTENLLFSTIDKKAVYLTIPVSMEDFGYQLYWYGYDIYKDGEGMIRIEKFTGDKVHEHGTHPTKDDIKAINDDQTFVTRHKGEDTIEMYPYRDFHTLTVSLLKNK